MKQNTIKAIIFCLIYLLLSCTQVKAEHQWTQQMEAEFQQHSKEVITKIAGSNYGNTSQENEKKSYPRAMIDFLAGNQEKAIAFLQSEDADAPINAHTLGIDFYSGFTLTGQVRKYFYFGKYLDSAYRQRMKKAIAQGSGGDWNGFKMMAYNQQRGVQLQLGFCVARFILLSRR
ncbi:MAG: hypothetical protein PUP91_22325 [Rhizonema sp. PD37]|nr:hypothetical protein [Rhizonema sp. PD37]